MRAEEMAGPTVPELRTAMLAYCETARTKAEILEHARCDRDIASRIMEQLVGQGKIMIAPGTASTSAMRWVVSAKAKAALKAMDGGSDD